MSPVIVELAELYQQYLSETREERREPNMDEKVGFEAYLKGTVHDFMVWLHEHNSAKAEVCGVLLHVGIAGNETCANPKPCKWHRPTTS
jgi:hypothetical protein